MPSRPVLSLAWPGRALWRPAGCLFLLLLLRGAQSLAKPGVAPALNGNTRPSVNVYMSEEEVKKLLGMCLTTLRPFVPKCFS